VKNKQSNSNFIVKYNWVLDDCIDSVLVSSVTIIVAPGLRSNHSAINIEFLEIFLKKYQFIRHVYLILLYRQYIRLLLIMYKYINIMGV